MRTALVRRLTLGACIAGATLVPSISAHHDVTPIEERYPSGQLRSRGLTIDGRRAGRYETWWPSGIRRSMVRYRDDVFDGEYRTWTITGAPYELKHFVNGREDGVQQAWDERGELYLNYVVRDGRRFGYINAKPCLSADADGQTTGARP